MQLRSWLNTHVVAPVNDLRAQGAVVPWPMYEVARIHFPTGSAALDQQDRQVLDRLAGLYAPLLGTLPRPLVMAFIGVADPRGRDPRNLALSRQRAQNAADWFQKALAAAAPAGAAGAAFLVDGRGEASAAEAADHAVLGPDAALASWRRVGVYANLPPQWVEAGLQRLRHQVRKMAERALRQTAAARAKLQSNVERLRQQAAATAGSHAYAFNFADLAWEQQRLEDHEQRLEELKKALDAGTEAFLAWQKSRRPTVERNRDVLQRLEAERRRLQAELTGAGAGEPELRATIEWLTDAIDSLKEYIQLIEEGKVTGA